MEIAVAYDFYDLVEDEVDESSYEVHEYFREIAGSIALIDTYGACEQTIQVYNLIMEINEERTRRVSMKEMLSYDIRDVPVMLGSASFVGAVSGMVWKIATSTPSPPMVILAGCLAGLVAGRILSVKAKERG
ncbi:TPA: hypothetical protein SLP05_003742 [Pseudomonas putida]|uniref:hypothetical protein n=1 Tax=Pseudomonas TaxID=286 RepID=UPI0015FAFF6D|nr:MULTISPECIES: hypothetical protein [Pseudomonas]ELF6206795.1 hypothetical protein [Pseudomonas putida]MBA6135318.1 hypothetical protein [Pseudomonas juntendi]MDD2076398.1 hypothetical protein [Pseudomonas putida]HDS1692158.1 hypothetical protein [Pseudomonas putida]HEJ1056149.1 hypothetical protein [Pseudomonas putida]